MPFSSIAIDFTIHYRSVVNNFGDTAPRCSNYLFGTLGGCIFLTLTSSICCLLNTATFT